MVSSESSSVPRHFTPPPTQAASNDPEMDELLNEGFGSTDTPQSARSPIRKSLRKVMNEYTGIYYA